jgi:hypothetical protein
MSLGHTTLLRYIKRGPLVYVHEIATAEYLFSQMCLRKNTLNINANNCIKHSSCIYSTHQLSKLL